MVTALAGPILSISIAVTVVLAIRWLVVRAAHAPHGSSAADTVMEPLAGIYGLLLAFMVGSIADRGIELRTGLQAEAEAFQRLEMIARQLPAPVAARLEAALQGYAHAETATRQAGGSPTQSGTILNELWLEIAGYQPTGAVQAVLQSEALADVRVLSAQRTIGARANRYAYGPLIWMVLLTGAASIFTVCIVAGLADPHGRIYLAALTAVIALTLYVFFALSRPLANVAFPTLTDLAR